MKETTKNIIVNIIGALILFIGILAVFNAFYYNRIYDIFWFCYIGMTLLGLGIIIRNIPLIKSQLYILIIPDIIWTWDFLTFLIKGKSAIGIVDYFFASSPLAVKIVSLQHVYTIPLVIIAIALIGKEIKTNRAGVLISVIEITFIYLATLGFTLAENNVNCAYKFCGDLVIKGPYYPLVWYAGALLMVFVTRYFLNLFFQRFIKDDPEKSS